MTFRIPFNKAYIAGPELEYAAHVLKNLSTSGDGVYSKRCQSLLERTFHAKKVLLTTSCTSALEMAVMLCDLKPGDEVILPSFTFVSSANAFVRQGIQPRFVDIRPDTKNIDESLIEEAITDKTRAIMPVHYAGVACEMDSIKRIAKTYQLRIIEDAAQGANARYKGSYLGTIGDLGAYSFHETKNYSCGEGGALLINDERLIDRSEIIREKGTDRSRFSRGEVDKYTWIDVGSSFLPSDILAALLFAQLEALDEINTRRKAIYDYYLRELAPLADEGLIELPIIPSECETNFHMFYVLVKDLAERVGLLEHLKSKKILAVSHYVPLHNSPMGRALGCNGKSLPVTEDVSERLLRLPFYVDLTHSDLQLVRDEIFSFFGHH